MLLEPCPFEVYMITCSCKLHSNQSRLFLWEIVGCCGRSCGHVVSRGSSCASSSVVWSSSLSESSTSPYLWCSRSLVSNNVLVPWKLAEWRWKRDVGELLSAWTTLPPNSTIFLNVKDLVFFNSHLAVSTWNYQGFMWYLWLIHIKDTSHFHCGYTVLTSQ